MINLTREDYIKQLILGPRCRRFKSCHLDHRKNRIRKPFLSFLVRLFFCLLSAKIC
nr:MAG TPA: hypothetical protein [Caudoviricetes sp.]